LFANLLHDNLARAGEKDARCAIRERAASFEREATRILDLPDPVANGDSLQSTLSVLFCNVGRSAAQSWALRRNKALSPVLPGEFKPGVCERHVEPRQGR